MKRPKLAVVVLLCILALAVGMFEAGRRYGSESQGAFDCAFETHMHIKTLTLLRSGHVDKALRHVEGLLADDIANADTATRSHAVASWVRKYCLGAADKGLEYFTKNPPDESLLSMSPLPPDLAGDAYLKGAHSRESERIARFRQLLQKRSSERINSATAPSGPVAHPP